MGVFGICSEILWDFGGLCGVLKEFLRVGGVRRFSELYGGLGRVGNIREVLWGLAGIFEVWIS